LKACCVRLCDGLERSVERCILSSGEDAGGDEDLEAANAIALGYLVQTVGTMAGFADVHVSGSISTATSM
jgi:hypothetical protein